MKQINVEPECNKAPVPFVVFIDKDGRFSVDTEDQLAAVIDLLEVEPEGTA